MGERNRASGAYSQGGVSQVLRGTATVDPPSIGAAGKTSVTFTVTGAQVGDVVDVQPPAALETGLVVVAARVSALNTVQVDLYNPTAGAIDGTSRSWTYTVLGLA